MKRIYIALMLVSVLAVGCGSKEETVSTPDGSVTMSNDGKETHQAQVVRLAQAGTYDSLCLHSDTPGAVTLAQAARRALSAARVPIAAFVR